ncbi:hypothetical protein [Vibrio parahaemolyticus]|nr:hypothetical protein [Vibrio parahaemolyticus]
MKKGLEESLAQNLSVKQLNWSLTEVVPYPTLLVITSAQTFSISHIWSN